MEHRSGASTHVLIERHRAGDSAALPTLLQRYYPRVERIVRVRMGAARLAREEIADVVQGVFLRMITAVERFEPRDDARFIDNVARMAQNEISNHARRDRALKRGGGTAREVPLHAESATNWEIPADTTGVHSKASRAEELEILDQCLSGLSEAHREVIVLRDYAGGDWKMVAEAMGRPTVEACQELHRRARRELGRLVLARP